MVFCAIKWSPSNQRERQVICLVNSDFLFPSMPVSLTEKYNSQLKNGTDRTWPLEKWYGIHNFCEEIPVLFWVAYGPRTARVFPYRNYGYRTTFPRVHTIFTRRVNAQGLFTLVRLNLKTRLSPFFLVLTFRSHKNVVLDHRERPPRGMSLKTPVRCFLLCTAKTGRLGEKRRHSNGNLRMLHRV